MSDLPNLDLQPPQSPKRQTLDEFLGTAQTLDEFLAPPKVELFGRKPMMDYFMESFRRGVGDAPFGEPSQKLLREAGLLSGEFKDKLGEIQKNDKNLLTSFGDAVLGPTAKELETIFRVVTGAAYGFSGELQHLPIPIPQLRGTPGRGLTGVVPSVEFGVPKDLTPAAALEAFPVGRGTGLPTRPQSLTPALRVDLDAAERLGVFGERPAEIGLRALDPEQPLRLETRGVGTGELAPVTSAEAPLRALDVNDVARFRSPEVFERYDALADQRRVLDETLAEMKASDPALIAAQSNIDDILGKVNGVESRLTNRAAARLEEARDVLDEAIRKDSPEQNAIRLQRANLDADMRQMAPEVSQAYREARDSFTPEEQLTVTRRDLAPENVDIRVNPEGGFDVESPNGIFRAVNENEAITIARREAMTPAVRNLAQRAPSIRQQVLSDLTAAGRQSREATALADLVAEHYATRGERLDIPAQELFDRDMPSVKAEGPRYIVACIEL